VATEKVPFIDKIESKMQVLGVTRRKAKELAKAVASTFSRRVEGNITEKLTNRLMKLGLTEIRATELARGLAPTVRASLKAKAAKRVKRDTVKEIVQETADSIAQEVDQTVEEVTDLAEDPELDKVAPRVNGHRLRLDMPVLPMAGGRGVDVLRVMDGWSTRGTYLVAAVKGPEGICAIRQLGNDFYNVKFYPTMEHWGRTQEELRMLGAYDYLRRGPYERMHGNAKVTAAILDVLAAEAKPRNRVKALVSRMKAITFGPLEKAFGYLHKRVSSAA
jgi:uncharacterized protein (DUF2267 family)